MSSRLRVHRSPFRGRSAHDISSVESELRAPLLKSGQTRWGSRCLQQPGPISMEGTNVAGFTSFEVFISSMHAFLAESGSGDRQQCSQSPSTQVLLTRQAYIGYPLGTAAVHFISCAGACGTRHPSVAVQASVEQCKARLLVLRPQAC